MKRMGRKKEQNNKGVQKTFQCAQHTAQRERKREREWCERKKIMRNPPILSPVFVGALDGEEVSLSFAEPELATVASRLEVEELDGVQQVRFTL